MRRRNKKKDNRKRTRNKRKNKYPSAEEEKKERLLTFCIHICITFRIRVCIRVCSRILTPSIPRGPKPRRSAVSVMCAMLATMMLPAVMLGAMVLIRTLVTSPGGLIVCPTLHLALGMRLVPRTSRVIGANGGVKAYTSRRG